MERIEAGKAAKETLMNNLSFDLERIQGKLNELEVCAFGLKVRILGMEPESAAEPPGKTETGKDMGVLRFTIDQLHVMNEKIERTLGTLERIVKQLD